MLHVSPLGMLVGGDHVIENAALFTSGSELSATYSITAPWTLSAWIKTTATGAEELILGATGGEVHLNANYTLEAETTSSTALFRDPAYWMHIHISDNGMFVNGVSHGSVTTTNLSNQKLFDDFEGYAAEVHLKSGTDAVANFGEETDDGFWIPVLAASGEHYFKFSNGADLGENSGSAGNWTATSVTQVSDTPTDSSAKGTANYATFNPLDPSTLTATNGNKTLTAASGWRSGRCNMPIPEGEKVYFEILHNAGITAGVGVGTMETNLASHPGNDVNGWAYHRDGSIYNSSGTASWGTAWAQPSTIGVAVDRANNAIYFRYEGVWQNSGDPESGASKTGAAYTNLPSTGVLVPLYGASSSNSTLRFADDELTGSIPSGYTTLCSLNITRNQTGKLSDHFATVLHTGTGAELAVTGVGFQPDFVWTKGRSGATEHVITDSLRGATKELSSNDTGAEETVAQGLKSFDTDGFTLGTDGSYNTSSATYVNWCIKADQTASGATTGAGTAKTYSTIYNPDLGFAIIEYVGNGTLGQTIPLPTMTDAKKPFMAITKATSTTGSWVVWVDGWTDFEEMTLNTTNAKSSSANERWDVSEISATAFGLGDYSATNTNNQTNVMYVFWETDFCKPVNYTGNASTDGSFLNLGGAPAWIMAKRYDGVTDWWMTDNVMNPTNPTQYWIKSNASEAQQTGINPYSDFISNGYKHRATHSTANGSGSNYIGVAFVEPEPADGPQLRAK